MLALRSTEYEQGHSVLHNKTSRTWCCLGVACDLAVKDGVEVKREESDWGRSLVVETFDTAIQYPPLAVMQWAGIDDTGMLDFYVRVDEQIVNNPIFRASFPANALGDIIGLSQLNDGGLSFSDIADIIERQL